MKAQQDEELIPVYLTPHVVDSQDPVSIAVKSHPSMGFPLQHLGLKAFQMRGAAV
jgi:hypothetical protein